MSNRESTSRVVLVNTLAFAVSFAVWVLLGPSTRLIAKELAIDPATAAAVKAAPILVGSVMRIPVGMITDRLGARLTFPLVQLVGLAGVLVLSFAHGLTLLVVGGLVLGMVGTTFVVGVQSVSSWVPAERHGFALGIFGAGNVGTALTTLCLPFLNAAFGWRTSLRVSSLALLVSALAYYAVIRNANASGEKKSLGALLAPLSNPRALRFGLYYMASFGAFVATTLTVSDLYIDGYGVNPKSAGLLATTFAVAASLVRIWGGKLADRHGAAKVMTAALAGTVVALAPVLLRPPLALVVLLVFAAGICMGVGAAATFKYIPQHFAGSVGTVGGIVGALGGVGGFFLPMLSAWTTSHGHGKALAFLPTVLLAAAAASVHALYEARAGQRATRPAGALIPSVPPPR